MTLQELMDAGLELTGEDMVNCPICEWINERNITSLDDLWAAISASQDTKDTPYWSWARFELGHLMDDKLKLKFTECAIRARECAILLKDIPGLTEDEVRIIQERLDG